MNLQEVEKEVARVASEYIGSGPLNMNDSMYSLDLDSLDMVELTLELEEHFPGLDFGVFEMSESTTLADVSVEVHRLIGDSA